MLNALQKKELLKIARSVLLEYFLKGTVPKIKVNSPELKASGGAFVTLQKKGQLRGCIGLIESDSPLYQNVRDMAIEAATQDPRFMPVTEAELAEIEIEISALSVKHRIKSIDEIELGTHGVIVKQGFARGVFLPQVATETGWNKIEFMRNLCAGKAGLKADAYLDPKTEMFVFTAEVFSEKEFKE